MAADLALYVGACFVVWAVGFCGGAAMSFVRRILNSAV